MAGIFIGFEFMAVIDILNKIEHKTISLNESVDFVR